MTLSIFKNLSLTFIFLLSLNSFCNAETFSEFNDKITGEANIAVLNMYWQEETDKYHSTKDNYYLYNTKYIEFFISCRENKQNKAIAALCWVIEDGKKTNNIQYAWFYYHVASNLNSLKVDKISLEYAKTALKYANSSHDNYIKRLTNSLIGTIYFNLKNYSKAYDFFEISYKQMPLNDQFNRASMLNNLALCEMNRANNSKAIFLFNRALFLLYKIPNKSLFQKTFTIIVEGNKGSSLNRIGKHDSSIKYLEKEIAHYFRSGIKDDYGKAEPPLIELLNIYRKKNDAIGINRTIEKLEFVESELGSRKEYPRVTEALFNYYSETNNQQKALETGSRLYKLLDNYFKFTTQQTKMYNEIIYSDKLAHLKNEKRSQEQELEIANNEKTSFKLISIVSIILVLLTIGIGVIIFVNKKRNLQKDLFIEEQKRELEINKNIILENEIKMQQDKITNLAMNLTLKKETEKTFLTKINELKRNKNINTEEVLKDLQISVTNLMNIDKKTVFNCVETDSVLEDFKSTLAKSHPSLSKSDLEYCCYFRLNMSAKEIGSLHGQSDGSVRVLKNKIKKKLSLDPEESLNDYLININA